MCSAVKAVESWGISTSLLDAIVVDTKGIVLNIKLLNEMLAKIK
jgi:hypothetical protein